jgi:hypothetical protein
LDFVLFTIPEELPPTLLKMDKNSEVGTLSVHMAYIGSEFMTKFKRVSLPVYDIREDIRNSLLSNLDTNGINLATGGLVVPKGRPR